MTRKDGSRGRLRIDYGEASQPEAALKWLWRYLEGASSAGELYGRALVVIAAEQYAARMVLPASQRGAAIHWGSRQGLAAKALRKLAGPHLPASLKALQRAVERVHKHAEEQPHEAAERSRTGAESASAPGEDELVREDLDEVEEQAAEPLADA